jgi:hypothetical protein
MTASSLTGFKFSTAEKALDRESNDGLRRCEEIQHDYFSRQSAETPALSKA